MTLVASDGYDVEPLPIESLIINPGERYDVLLTTDKPVDNYMIFAETLQAGMRVRTEWSRVVLPILITTMTIIIMEVSVAWQLCHIISKDILYQCRGAGWGVKEAGWKHE